MPANSTSCDSGAPSGEGWKDKGPYKMPKWDLQDDIVISGISGRFPESNNVEELKKNLFEGIDMITENDRRWKPGIFGTPKRMGKLKEIDKFDMFFFGVHGKQADKMDPTHRLLLESVYEAIFDAGVCPSTLKGKSVGVYVGCSDRSASGETVPEDQLTGYELLGMSIAMLANRVSFTFGFTGPSMAVDTACSSTLHALNEAMLAIRNNRCDAAIVGGGTITLSISNTISFTRLGLISKEGTCKVFDATANGYVRSEAVGAIFLQRARDAKRCYATVLHSKINNDGAKPEGISFPSASLQKQLFTEVFSETDIDPLEVNYVEAHGTGTVAGDREESNAIADFFCKGRDTPLLVGSVKSNLGHAEAASGTCTLAKVILSMEGGEIPPNLHYEAPNPHVPALVNGNMKVVSERTPWKPGLVAVNNFGFGGSNAHVLLKANQKEYTPGKERKIPRLALASGRSEAAVKYIFKKIEEENYSDEALVLLEDACKAPTVGMRYRGYALVQTPGEELSPVIEPAPTTRRPVWFLFSGMGSQWSGMAKEIMKLDVFAKSIKLSAQVLKPCGVDLLHLLTDATEEDLNDIVAPFVTIAAVQIALVDVVKSLGITPDGIVGHSVGELGCAYADGCFTAEQMLLAAYWRGTSCTRTKLIKGQMAAVGMTWEETQKRCPEGIFPVCHNAEDSVTISGPAEKVKKFVEELNAEKIFARGVKTCDIAFHSKYVEPASVIMKKELTKIIPNPLPRSARWVSSSVPEEKWGEPEAQLSSADYHVNNLLSPVLFNDAMSKVPKNAIVIEFAPHSLLQAIVKRILGTESTYIGLMKRGHEDNLVHCLNAVGKMYMSNLDPSARNLYEPVTFPVPRGTPMLNSLIQWDHSNPCHLLDHETFRKIKDGVGIDTMRGSQNEFLTGHKIDGRVLFPFMGYVNLAWKALAKHLELEIDELPVVIEDFSVYRASLLPKAGQFMFTVRFVSQNGSFLVVESGSIVASGRIYQGDDNTLRMNDERLKTLETESETSLILEADDFYKELRLRGYEYGPTFQGVVRADANGLKGTVKWQNRWVSFMDSMLQVPILCVPLRALLLPTRVKSIRINPLLKPEKDGDEIPLTFNPDINVCRAGPVEIEGMHCGIAPKRKDFHSSPVLEEQVFVPLHDSCVLTDHEMLQLEEYSHVCSTVAHKILLAAGKTKKEISSFLNGFKEAPEELTEEMMKKEQNDHALLKVLKEILEVAPSNGLKDSVEDVLSKYPVELARDALSTSIHNEKSLRAVLDVVLDNQATPKMKILEVSSSSIVHKDVLKMMNMTTLGLMKFDYSVARINPEPVPEGLLDAGLKTVTVDLEKDALSSENDLIVAKDVLTDCSCDDKKVVEAMVASLKPKGFVLIIERTLLSPAEKFLFIISGKKKLEQKESKLEQLFKSVDLTLVSKKSDQMTSVMYLLRKRDNNSSKDSKPEIISVSDDNGYIWIADLKEKLKENEEKSLSRQVWLTAEYPTSGVVGLVNCLKQEPGGKHLRYFFNFNKPSSGKRLLFSLSDPTFQEIIQTDLTINIIHNNQWGMFRHRLLDSEPTPVPRKNSFLNVMKRGDLSSIKWIQNAPPKKTLNSTEVTVEIYYSALNFRDIMLASGKLPPDADAGSLALQECILGLEYVGRDPNGRRVMGVALAKALATSISVPKDMLISVPDHWSMEEASTVPVVYMTSYYALLIRGDMKRGESVLIHSGTGGVGQAAIAIALSMGCKVFVTVGSEEKKESLKGVFPQLNDNHVFNSRDVMFEYQIMGATKGKGVDLVLNSLADDKLQASVRCLRKNGRFLEIGKYDIAMNSKLGMAALKKNITFHAVFLDMVFEDDDTTLLNRLKDIMSEGVKSGVVRPLKANVFNWDQGEEAFRFMASGKHVGKVVLKIRDEEEKKIASPTPVNIPSIPRTYLDETKSYIITGGLGGFGFELATWLVERGARKLVLSSRSPVKNEYQKLWMQRWELVKTEVVVSNEDISNAEGCKNLLDQAKGLGPVGGIFHLAMVLKDGLFENLQPEDFETVSLSKVKGVHQLDQLSRQMCPLLDHFVVFSSISCGRGNPGQSNYGYANSVMERVVELRKSQGLPGLAIQWGGIGDVGVVYEKMGGNEVILKGTIPQRLSSCLTVLDRFMQEDHTVVSSFVPVEKAAFSAGSEEDVVALLCNVLGIKDRSSVKPEMTLGELGMDSLMGVEIKQVLETEYDTVLTVPEVRQLSIKELEEIGKKKKEGAGVKNPSHLLSGGMELKGELHVPTETLVALNDSKDSQCVFFIHPMEGHVNMLKPLAKNIKRKVYGLQFTEKVPRTSVHDMASYYVQKIKAVQPHGPYSLVGYSYGTLVQLEVAVILQKTDQVKAFICLDGSPRAITEGFRKYYKDLANKSLSHPTQKLHKAALIEFMNLVFTVVPPQFEDSLINVDDADLESHTRTFLSEYLGDTIDIDQGIIMLHTVNYLSILAGGHEPSGKYRGRATLIKASDRSITDQEKVPIIKEEDMGLKEAVDGAVEIFSIKCNHYQLPQDTTQEVSKIINDRI